MNKGRLIVVLFIGICISILGCSKDKREILAVIKPVEAWPKISPLACRVVPNLPVFEVDTLHMSHFKDMQIGEVIKRRYNSYIVFQAPINIRGIENVIDAFRLNSYNLRESIFWLSMLSYAEVVPIKNVFGDIQGYLVSNNGIIIPENYYTITNGRLRAKSIEIASIGSQDDIKINFHLVLESQNELFNGPEWKLRETTTPIVIDDVKLDIKPNSGYKIHFSVHAIGIVYIERTRNNNQEFLLKWTENYLPYTVLEYF